MYQPENKHTRQWQQHECQLGVRQHQGRPGQSEQNHSSRRAFFRQTQKKKKNGRHDDIGHGAGGVLEVGNTQKNLGIGRIEEAGPQGRPAVPA